MKRIYCANERFNVDLDYPQQLRVGLPLQPQNLQSFGSVINHLEMFSTDTAPREESEEVNALKYHQALGSNWIHL